MLLTLGEAIAALRAWERLSTPCRSGKIGLSNFATRSWERGALHLYQVGRLSTMSKNGFSLFRIGIRPAARRRTSVGISTAPSAPTAIRLPFSSTAAPAAHPSKASVTT
jgi:hypothetical protein